MPNGFWRGVTEHLVDGRGDRSVLGSFKEHLGRYLAIATVVLLLCGSALGTGYYFRHELRGAVMSTVTAPVRAIQHKATEVKEAATDKVHTVRDAAREKAANLGEKAHNIGERATDKLGDMKDSAKEKASDVRTKSTGFAAKAKAWVPWHRSTLEEE